VRPLFLHYPNDPNTHMVRYQFLLGPDLMVAPVVEKGTETVDAYFPQGTTWIDLWTGEDAGGPGKWTTVPARLGKPAVFLRKGAAASQAIVDGLKATGVL
jgi:sulfoquinovosidase